MNWDLIMDMGIRGVVGGVILAVVGFALVWAIKITRRSIRWMRDNHQELPRIAGSATASAVDSAKSVKDAFVEGYKNKR